MPYYTTLEYYLRKFDDETRRCAADISDKESFLKWQKTSKEKLTNILKLDVIESCQLMPEVLEVKELADGIMYEKVLLQVQPKTYMPIHILIPKECKDNKNAKCFLAMSGHLGGGAASIIGDRSDDRIAQAIDKYNYDYGLQLASKGYVVICPESRGFGERRELAQQKDEFLLACSCYQLARIATGFGYSLLGLLVWDVMKAVDYIFQRGEWDTENLGILGFSGGGMQALYSAAVDERIKKIIISGYMYGYKEALLVRNTNCSCNYVDGIWNVFDMGDIGAMLAPRNFVIQSGNEDNLNGISGLKNVYSQVEVIQDSYDVLEAEDRVLHDVCNGGHKWYKDKLDDYLKVLY